MKQSKSYARKHGSSNHHLEVQIVTNYLFLFIFRAKIRSLSDLIDIFAHMVDIVPLRHDRRSTHGWS
jgi:hypothetical protein